MIPNELFVSIETAKALKCAGYPQTDAMRYYNCEEDKVSTYAPICVVQGRDDVFDAEECARYSANYIAVPLYAEALNWLDKMCVYVRIVVPRNGVSKWDSSVFYTDCCDLAVNFDSREDAANAAIYNAAKKMMEKKTKTRI